MLRLLVLLCLLIKAFAAQIHGYGDATAVYGGDAHYRCAIAPTEGLLQVTWQRLFRDESIENLATYSRKFGQQVNEPYREKVLFTEASLNSTSITLKNVTWEDESCYVCSFNAYPHGSTRKQTCLTVRGISEASATPVASKGGDSEAAFSCSATGKPAPTVRWDFHAGAALLSQTQTSTVANGDRTFTSSRNVTLRIPADWDGHVDCVLNSGVTGQRLVRIPVTGRAATTTTTAEGGAHAWLRLSPSVVAPVVMVLIFVSGIVAAVVLRQRRSKGSRRSADAAQEEGLAQHHSPLSL